MNWPDTGPTLICPACGGPIGFWAIEPAFNCHHCGVMLASNHRRVQWACFYVLVGAWTAAIAILVVNARRSVGEAALLSGQLLAPIAAALIWLVLKYKVQLVQVSRQRGA